jgi:hypothetical protein
MTTNPKSQNRFLAGAMAALVVSVLVVFTALCQAVAYVPAYA